jgi:hypothetical protein
MDLMAAAKMQIKLVNWARFRIPYLINISPESF